MREILTFVLVFYACGIFGALVMGVIGAMADEELLTPWIPIRAVLWPYIIFHMIFTHNARVLAKRQKAEEAGAKARANN